MASNAARSLSAHSRINVDDPEEFAFWCGFFDVSEPELHRAIALVGNSVAPLVDYFEEDRAA
jgi:hypothetical protein